MEDGDVEFTNVRGDLEKWSEMLKRQQREREQKIVAEERDRKLKSLLKKKWIWW